MPEVKLTFVLKEHVDPDAFAGKIAFACAKGYALRVGEGVRVPSQPGKVYEVERPHA